MKYVYVCEKWWIGCENGFCIICKLQSCLREGLCRERSLWKQTIKMISNSFLFQILFKLGDLFIFIMISISVKACFMTRVTFFLIDTYNLLLLLDLFCYDMPVWPKTLYYLGKRWHKTSVSARYRWFCVLKCKVCTCVLSRVQQFNIFLYSCLAFLWEEWWLQGS